MHALGEVLAVSSSGAYDDFWYGPVSRDDIGPIDPDAPMTIPAFYAAVTYVAEDVAKLPLNIYEDRGDLGTEPARDHELQPLLHDQPNKRQTAIQFREMQIAWAMLRGESVAEIRRGASISTPGRPTRINVIGELVPLHPDLIRRETQRDGSRRYKYRDPLKGGKERTILEDETFRVAGRQSRSVLDFAARNLGTILAQDKVARFMFDRGLKHGGVISAKTKLADPTRLALRKALDEYSVNGPRAGRPLLLEDGMTWESVSMTARDAELLESQQWSVSQVCRWIRIPPHKVFDLTRSTNNNIESQGVDYVTDSILGWAIRVEQAIWRDLIIPGVDGVKEYFAKHILDGLLRGDFETRAKAYALAIMWGWMTRNEVRRKEDLNPIDGLDDPLTPGNMTTDPDGTTTVSFPQREAILAQVGPGTKDEEVVGAMLTLYASDAASRMVRREVSAITKLAERTAGDPSAWGAGVRSYYDEHAEQLAKVLHLPEFQARQYAREQTIALEAMGPAAMGDWLTDRVSELTAMAVSGAQVEIRRPPQAQITVMPSPVQPAATTVNVEPSPPAQVQITAPIQIDVAPAAVDVSPQIHVPPTPRVTKSIERDDKNQIVRIVEEPD